MLTKEKFIKFIRNITDDDINYRYSMKDIFSELECISLDDYNLSLKNHIISTDKILIDDLMNKIDLLEVEVSSLQDDKDELYERINNLKSELEDADSYSGKSNLDDEINDLENEIDDLEREVENLEYENKNLRKNIFNYPKDLYDREKMDLLTEMFGKYSLLDIQEILQWEPGKGIQLQLNK